MGAAMARPDRAALADDLDGHESQHAKWRRTDIGFTKRPVKGLVIGTAGVDRLPAVADATAPGVELVAVDDPVLEQLVLAATTQAAADEVTPPLTAGQLWTATRVQWLRQFHRECRSGLAGPRGEATWAIVVHKRVVGSVRLKHTEQQDALEAGIWLTRGARGSGVGRAAMAAALVEAAATNANEVRADTTVGNTAALAMLSSLGFDFAPVRAGQDVRARLALEPSTRGDNCR